jgi:GTPase
MSHVARHTSESHRSGYVALVGRPNAGKSTLLNALVGRKLSIVTPKPQTTRHRVLGLLSEDDYQIVLLDTPGLLQPRYGLQQRMMQTVRESTAEADLVLLLADATRPLDEVGLGALEGQRAILVLNKVDLLPQDQVLPLAERYAAAYPFEEIVPVSALKRFNLDRLLSLIVARLPEGPPYYPKDQLSEHPEKFFVAELIREQVFRMLREEVPYATQVNIVQYEEREPPEKDLIDAEIVVERATQKGILIGAGGSTLKRIGTAARREIEDFLERPVFLRLFVKVRDDWRNNETFLNQYGY